MRNKTLARLPGCFSPIFTGKIIGLVQFSTGGHVLSNAKIHLWYEFRAWKTLKQFLRLSWSLFCILGLAFLALANFFPLIRSVFFLFFYLVFILFYLVNNTFFGQSKPAARNAVFCFEISRFLLSAEQSTNCIFGTTFSGARKKHYS